MSKLVKVKRLNTWTFNLAQLATIKQAQATAIKISTGPIIVGGGVKPQTDKGSTSGYYRPDWVGGPGGFAEPNFTDPNTGERYFYLHYRFRNGAEGMNVGLIMDLFRRYPTSPHYVMGVLALEADAIAHSTHTVVAALRRLLAA